MKLFQFVLVRGPARRQQPGRTRLAPLVIMRKSAGLRVHRTGTRTRSDTRQSVATWQPRLLNPFTSVLTALQQRRPNTQAASP